MAIEGKDIVDRGGMGSWGWAGEKRVCGLVWWYLIDLFIKVGE